MYYWRGPLNEKVVEMQAVCSGCLRCFCMHPFAKCSPELQSMPMQLLDFEIAFCWDAALFIIFLLY